MSRFLLAALLALAVPLVAHALATEHFDNTPFTATLWHLPADVDTVANLPSRVYWYEVNGHPVFHYRGDVAAVNDAMAKFAKLKFEHKHIRFVAGPGETKNLQQTKTIPFDWNINIPAGFSKVSAEHPAVMTVHITVPKPTAKLDEAAVKQQIAELDSAMFAVRDAATKKLREIGFAGVPYFQAALKTTESAETRTRLEDLLARLKGIDLQRLELPKDIALIGPKDHHELQLKLMSDANAETRGRAVLAFARSAGDPAEIVAELEKFLAKETNEYAQRCVASAVTNLGADAKPLLPAMKKLIAAPDINVKQAFVAAVKKIEEAKPTAKPAAELATLRTEIQQALGEAREKGKK